METKTQRRGFIDTSRSRFAKVLAVSLLLHIPFTPWAALFGLLRLWSPAAEDVESPPITSIPVDLLEDPSPAPPAPAPPESGADSVEPHQPIVVHKKKPVPDSLKARDAGADAEQPDAETPDAALSATDAGSRGADAGASAEARDLADAGSPADAGPKPIGDPMLVAGVKQVADPNANVRITIYTAKIRDNPLGQRVGPLLRSLYQWRDFFGPTAIDPIRDIDQIFLVGPEFRDSRNVVAILKHHVRPDRLRTAVDALVRADRERGRWLDAGVPAASARADGSERRFILANATTLIVTPPSAYASALSARKSVRLLPSSGPEVALIYLATPWRAFIGWPIDVPKSIKWARVRITPTEDGGATAELEAADENPERAGENAAYLTRAANALSQLNLGFLGALLGQQSHRFIEHVAFSASGEMINGEARITASQLATVLDMAGAFLADRSARRDRAPIPGAAASAP